MGDRGHACGPWAARSHRKTPRQERGIRSQPACWLEMAVLLLGISGCSESSAECAYPEQTRPFLLGASADPPLGEVVLIGASGGNYGPVEFSAYVESEDAGQAVQAVLLVDHGDTSGVSNGPYRGFVPGNSLPPGRLVDGPRGPLSISWHPQTAEVSGCHTVTLMATHQFQQSFGAYYCAADSDDVDTLTWVVALCDLASPGNCPYQDCPVYGSSAMAYCDDEQSNPP